MGLGGGGPLNDEEEKCPCPPWLKPLLRETFFVQCMDHVDSHKNECNMYCLDCVNGPLCSLCLSAAHKHHRSIQIRRGCYQDVARVSDIQKYDTDIITQVQTYSINGAKVVFLNSRPQVRPAKGVIITAKCQVCQRTLLHSFRFCSLACKVVGLSRRQWQMKYRSGSIGRPSESQNKRLQGLNLSTPPPMVGNYRDPKRRRKGIPQRAPTGGLTL